MLRAYYAQQQHSTQDQDQDQDQDQKQEQTWPQKRWYRAYCQEDDDALAAVMKKFGIHAKEEAVRVALRLVAGDAVKVTIAAPVAKRIVVKIRARQS